MPTDQNPQSGRRQHFHRGRRGPDRRGPDRRPPQAGHERGPGEQVDVEQIMRDIRAQISQRHGIELSNQQIQELAARRLEAILDPRTIKPTLLDQLRRSAGSQADASPPDPQPAYTFEGNTLYESHNGFLRFIRRLLNPLLKLLFNPNPLVQALNTQTRVNKEAARREVERERRQTEWNALHYTLLQRLVTEVSRASIETQSLSMRVESLAAKVDFNERRVRGLENTAHQATPAPRVADGITAAVPSPGPPATDTAVSSTEGQSEGARRRRRRRRGRRSPGIGPTEAIGTTTTTLSVAALEGSEAGDEESDDASIAVSFEDEDRAGPPVAWDDVDSSEPVAAEPFRPESSTEPPTMDPPPIETSTSDPVPHFETHEAPLSPQPAEPSASLEPSTAPDEPFPRAPINPPDPGPADR